MGFKFTLVNVDNDSFASCMPSPASKSLIFKVFMVTATALALAACSSDDSRLAADLAPPQRVDVLAPPVAPDPSQMHPALQIARSRGLKTNVYFNEELQQAVARLQGMEETLGRLQNDLQGTAMAMQRVEMMRQEIDALNMRFQSLQERLMYAGPMLAPAPEHTMAVQTAVTDEMIASDVQGPTPLMGEMAASSDAQISKPVVDEKPAAAASSAPKAVAGANGVRIGTHADYVRIVLDVAKGGAKFTTNLDNAEKILTVETPDASFTGGGKVNSPVVSSWSAQGNVLAFVLKGDTKVIKTLTLKNPTRIMIDLAK